MAAQRGGGGRQCSTFLLDFSWIKSSCYSMHSFRLRYIVLGLLVYIQSAHCRTTCDTEFTDVASRTYLADIVFEGTVRGIFPTGDTQQPYNASFAVKKVLKGDLAKRESRYLPVQVGSFGPENPRECMTQVVSEGKYVVFLHKAQEPGVPFYRVSGLPEVSDKKALREVRKNACKKCAKRPSAKLVPKDPMFEEDNRIQLRCKYHGKPQPKVSWFKNDRPLRSNRTISIDHGKRSSRLRIRRAKKEDSGIYTCKVRSAVGMIEKHTSVTVTQEREPPKTSGEETWMLCDQQAYCLNGGTCYQLPDLGSEPFCRCTTQFIGIRCQFEEIFTILKELETREDHMTDRSRTYTGLVVAFLVFLIILLASYCLARRRRIKHERKKKEKQAATAAAMRDTLPVNGLCRPLPDGGRNGPITRDMAQMSFGAPPTVEHRSSCTQTDETCLCPVAAHPPPPRYQSPPPATPPASLPRQNTDPQPHRSSSSHHHHHHRHGTGSSSMHNLEHHSAPHPPPPPPPSTPVQYTVAVVESDPDKTSRQSSPSQNSKTESQHGEGGGASKVGGTGGSGAGLLDFDQRSDYDNQPRDDDDIEEEMDIIMEQLQQKQQQIRSEGEEEEEEEEESSSNGDEEQALFLKIQKPSAPRANNNKRYSGGSGGGGKNKKQAWDEYGNMSPSHAMDQYSCNRYANDDDIIENRQHGRRGSEKDNHRNHHHHHYQPQHNQPQASRYPAAVRNYGDDDDGYLDGEMYDPDPDATIV